MKVVLTQDIAHVGKKGETVTVSNGYGINFLIPRGVALKADSPQGLVYAGNYQAGKIAKQSADKISAEAITELVGEQFNLSVEANESGKLFGALNEAKIADSLNALTQSSLEAKNIKLSNGPIKELGSYTVSLKSGDSVIGDITIEVSQSA